MSATEQPIAANPTSAVPVYVAVCSLLIIFALVLGVGLASNLVLRHMVQIVPFWVAVVLGFRCSRDLMGGSSLVFVLACLNGPHLGVPVWRFLSGEWTFFVC